MWTRVSSSDGNRYILRGSFLSVKSDYYLQESSNLAFVAYKTYAYEAVYYSAELKELPGQALKFSELFPSFDLKKEIHSPYLFWYCTRPSYESVVQELPSHHTAFVKLFAYWVHTNSEREYADAEDQISRGVISSESMKYLVRPGNPSVSQGPGLLQAYQATSLANIWEDSAWAYEFDGSFYKKPISLELKLDVKDPKQEVELNTLQVVPLNFVTLRFEEYLSFGARRTGHVAKRNLSRTVAEITLIPSIVQLHPLEKQISVINRKEISPEQMNVDEPPIAPEIFFFPLRIVSFNLRRKKWVDLEVDLIKEVEWNKDSFDNLVIAEETKKLVQALITNRLVAERGTDMVDDKGNGLTILLHGALGTGKTFTAESVAELAEKPLYRVACSDIRAKPEDVEQYLESALHLGKIWDCVVLLDEADVFLQELTVFLRVLEYYDDILILTSNRVGTFDKAFKSRIQVKSSTPNIDSDDIKCYISELTEQQMNGCKIRNAITTSRQLAKFKNKKMSHADLKHVLNIAGQFNKYLSRLKEGSIDDEISRESSIR
ncbi:hypothetical protein TSTA_069470 [Talaromyces stipitatus ATCC 10500]|uniref:AAA+ ATPase domain-containing protein n=1 Tax=Talaromyces stipitatus (strain ATCC 10500 / CBS 375.48 / QM 6759 / NRRL 1006) TaxID=441959 RepID=B8LT19_TALSN|nr:uncharacterized protein TSTA_069470 [Talaromyces stipitatus ATCC 10500]EED23527.1 hypothetical protein TSTA_069470 [Talaromyces stipitatus ATCC 10500]